MEVAQSLPQELKEQAVTLTLNAYEAFLILDALAGFQQTDEWYDVYQKVARMAFEQTV